MFRFQRISKSGKYNSTTRPLVDHPPVMVPHLVRAITKSPRWFAMEKAACSISNQIAQDEQEQFLNKIRRKDARMNSSETSKRDKFILKKEVKQLKIQLEEMMSNKLGNTSPFSSSSISATTIPEEALPRFNVLDCTLGGGSHTEAVLEAGAPYCRVAALDCDAGGVERRAEKIQQKYGKSRFRPYLGYRFSQIETLFGPKSFDTVIIDPGPNFSQLSDPTRGFSVDSPDDFSLFDMRYSRRFQSTALDILNKAEEPDLWNCATELALLPNPMARHIVRMILRFRPFINFAAVLSVLQSNKTSVGDIELNGGGVWYELSSHQFGRLNAVSRFLFALRAMVNQEENELYEGIRAAVEVLEPDGRLIFFSRLPWEKEAIRLAAETNPYLLTTFEMKIEKREIVEFSQPMETIMHVLQKTAEPATEIKNLSRVGKKTDEEIKLLLEEEKMKKLMSLDQMGTRNGFPANKFASHPRPSFKEQRKAKHNDDPVKMNVYRDEKTKMPRY